MSRLLLLLLLIAGAYWLPNAIAPSRVALEGGSVRLAADELDVRFLRSTPVSESFMVFGGLGAGGMRNRIDDVTLATLSLPEARRIHASHPDFHRCSSPGAAQAKNWVETTRWIGATRGAVSTLRKALRLHEKRVRSGGERTCLRVEGARLALQSIRVRSDGTDLTPQFRTQLAGAPYHLAERAELVDCRELLR